MKRTKREERISTDITRRIEPPVAPFPGAKGTETIEHIAVSSVWPFSRYSYIPHRSCRRSTQMKGVCYFGDVEES